MPVVQIRHMRVLVYQRRVCMQVTVSPLWHGLMAVVMMTVTVCMRVLMLKDLMGVLVVVRLNQMQDHPGQHQCPSEDQQHRGCALSKPKSTQCANERSERKH